MKMDQNISVLNESSTNASLANRFKSLEFFAPKGEGFKLHYEFFKNFTSLKTREAYKSDLKLFFEFFSNAFGRLNHPTQIERFHLVAYKEFLSKMGGPDGEPCAPKTIGRKLGALNSYFKFLQEKDIVTKNPCEGIKRPRQEIKAETNALTDEQVRDLLSSLDNKTLTTSLHKAIIYTLFATGMRVSELIQLKRENFGKLNGLKVIRFKSKGGKFQILPLKNEVSKEIETYLRHMVRNGRSHHPKTPLFQPSQNHSTDQLVKPLNRSTITRILKKYCQKIGIFDRVSSHSARATLITSLLDKGIDLYKVSLAVGHSNPKTTKHYDKRNRKIEDSAVLEIDYF